MEIKETLIGRRKASATRTVANNTTHTAGQPAAAGGNTHTHANLTALDKLGEKDGYITVRTSTEDAEGNITYTDEKAKAGHADTATHAGTADELNEDGAAWKSIIARFLDKMEEVATQTVKGVVIFLKGIKAQAASYLMDTFFGEYVAGASGAAIWKDGDGNWHIETDHLDVRGKFTAHVLEVMHTSHIGGRLLNTAAHLVVKSVETDAAGNHVCRFVTTDSDGRTVHNMFAPGDQAICETFNLDKQAGGTAGNHYLWRLVTAVGTDTVTLSATDCAEGSDAPMPGDELVQLGNRTDTKRQGAIVLAATGSGAPYIRIYQGIDSYTLPTPKANLSPDEVSLMADSIMLTTPGGDNEPLADWLATLKTDMDTVREQTDKEYTLWFFDHDPTADNEPACEWTDEETCAKHDQDLFYNTASGHGWRWEPDTEAAMGYAWHDITDALTLRALEKAAEAQSAADDAKNTADDAQKTADNKRRVFVDQPGDDEEYEMGDLWVNATFGELYDNDILVCVSGKTAGTPFNIAHWQPAGYGTTSVIRQTREQVTVAVGDAASAKELAEKAGTAANEAADEAAAAVAQAANALEHADAAQMAASDNARRLAQHDSMFTVAFTGITSTRDALVAVSDAFYYDTTTGKLMAQEGAALVLASQFASLMAEQIVYDSEGNVSIAGQAGFVTTSQFASLFASQRDADGLVTEARVSALVEEEVSKVIVSADRISLEGYTTVNGNFHITDSGQVYMQNHIRRGTIDITPENYTRYAVRDEELSASLGYPYYLLRVTDVGSSFRFVDDMLLSPFPAEDELSLQVVLPGSREDLSTAREYLGSRCTIYNNSTRGIGVTGDIMTRENYEAGSTTFNSIGVGYGRYAELECVHGTDSAGMENIFWVLMHTGLSADSSR